MPSRESREHELNEVTWWAKWVDETVWVSKNCYAIFSDVFRDEFFFNRGGFIGVERIPEDAIAAIEREFSKRKLPAPSIFVEDSRHWDGIRKPLTLRGYDVAEKMLVMENQPRTTKSKSQTPPSNPKVSVTLVSPGAKKGRDLQEWTRTYLDAFYGNQQLISEVNRIMRKVVKDRKASVFLARIGRSAAGCAVMYRTAGGVAGAYCIGTAASFRGRGVASTIIQHMRAIAQEEGKRLILQTLASDSLESFYNRQGFKLAYTKSLFERHDPDAPVKKKTLPSGEAFGVHINRDTAAGTTKPFSEVFSGFERIESVRRLFGPETDTVIAKLKISLNSPRGYLRVDGETGNVIINPEYLKTGHERHLYLDAIHELVHVRQFMEGKELYDRRYEYFERPTEIEAYRVAVEEARVIGMDNKEIVDYLRVEWVTEEAFQKFISVMRIEEKEEGGEGD